MTLSPQAQDEMLARMRRIEGQARGVQRMLVEDRDCLDILTQLAAIRGAAHQISLLLAEDYALNCVSNLEDRDSANEAIAKLVSTLGKLA